MTGRYWLCAHDTDRNEGLGFIRSGETVEELQRGLVERYCSEHYEPAEPARPWTTADLTLSTSSVPAGYTLTARKTKDASGVDLLWPVIEPVPNYTPPPRPTTVPAKPPRLSWYWEHEEFEIIDTLEGRRMWGIPRKLREGTWRDGPELDWTEWKAIE